MSTQAQHMGGPNIWDQSQYAFGQSVELEEHPYSLDATAPVRRFSHQRQLSPQSLNIPITSSRPGSFPSQGSFEAPSGFVRQPHMRSSFSALDAELGLAVDTSTPSLGTSPHATHISPVYHHASMNPLDPVQANYQASQFGMSLESHHTPESSPNPNVVMNNHSVSPYLPTGPMQFATPLPLPPRQSELQSHYFNAQYIRPQQDFYQGTKRPKPNDEYDDVQGDQVDAQEQEAARPKPMGACARCKSLKVRCEFKNDSDTCKRCKSAGQECVIPGRKPRRAPPKREHLLNQIREQAQQIQELMAKIETLNNSAAVQSPRSPGSSLQSPMDSTSESVVPNAEMQDWISRARVSIREFGGLIPANDSNDTDSDEGNAAEELSDGEDESGYATAEDDTGRDVVGSPASSTSKRQAAQTTKLMMLPGEEAPYGLMAALSMRNARGKSVEPESSEAVGVARIDFFRPSPRPDTMRMRVTTAGVQLPHILARGIVSIKEADTLFNIYFEKMNPSTSLLDPILHTPQFVAMRSPFLFTISKDASLMDGLLKLNNGRVCRIASRFYESSPNLYRQLIEYGQLAAGTALISGTKNEEMCAAYLLMQLYPVPAKRWDEERSWIYLGVAIRVAQDINLNRPVNLKQALNEQNARILLSRQRIWLNCFNLDRSTGTQYGKRSIIPNTDYSAANCADWWQSSPYNLKGFDIHLSGYNAELRLINGFSAKIYGDPAHPLGLDKALNVAQLASDTDDRLRKLGEHWFKRLDEFEEEKTGMAEFRTELLKMAYAYARLVALSTGLKHAKDGQLNETTFIMRCFEAASDIVNAFVRRLFPTPERKILLRHGPDAQFVFVTFASAFLVKLLLPKYAKYFTYERRQEIRTLVQEAIDLLGAPEVVVDEKHGPKLFSRFLAGLLATQSVNPDTLSSTTSSGSRLRPKVAPLQGKDTNGLSPLPLNSNGVSPDLSSPTGFTGTPSPPQQYVPFENTSAYSPSAVDFGLGLQGADLNQGAAMPVDQELLDSIQFLSDPVWQDTTMPGFSWVSQLNSANTSMMHTNDYAMYEPLQYATASTY